MAGKYATSFVLSVIGAVLILTGVFILAFVSHQLFLYSSQYYNWGINLVPMVRSGFAFYLIAPILALTILFGALLTGSESEKKARTGSIIVLVFSIVVSWSFLVLSIFAGRFIPDVIGARNLGVSGLIDFLGGFVPSAIGTAGVILCISGAVLGLKRRPPSPSLLPKSEISRAGEYTTCPECGVQNSPSYKFCFRCGAKLQPVQPSSKPEVLSKAEVLELVTCHVCGKQTPGGAKYCSHCGAPLSGVEQLPPPPPDIESRLERLEGKIRELEEALKKAGQPRGGEEPTVEGEEKINIFEE